MSLDFLFASRFSVYAGAFSPRQNVTGKLLKMAPAAERTAFWLSCPQRRAGACGSRYGRMRCFPHCLQNISLSANTAAGKYARPAAQKGFASFAQGLAEPFCVGLRQIHRHLGRVICESSPSSVNERITQEKWSCKREKITLKLADFQTVRRPLNFTKLSQNLESQPTCGEIRKAEIFRNFTTNNRCFAKKSEFDHKKRPNVQCKNSTKMPQLTDFKWGGGNTNVIFL